MTDPIPERHPFLQEIDDCFTEAITALNTARGRLRTIMWSQMDQEIRQATDAASDALAKFRLHERAYQLYGKPLKVEKEAQ